MKYILLILLVFNGVITGGEVVSTKTNSSMEQLDHLADEALQLTRFGRYEEALSLLDRYAELFAEHGVSERIFTMDELRILTAAHHEAVKTLTSINLSGEEGVNKVTAFRLASDAVISKYQPLWSEMKSPIMKAFQQVKNAAIDGDGEAYNQQLNAFLSTYSIIQPSLKIDIPVEKLQKLDSKITFIDHYRARFADSKMVSELEGLETDLKKLFTDMQEDEADPSIWWIMLMTGSVIISTLSYVSWRKYRGQKTRKQRKDVND